MILTGKKNNGFTLIETLVVLFFACILLVVFFNLYDWHGRVYYYQEALIRVSTSNRQALLNMQNYVAQSNRVLVSASVNGTTYTTSANVLVLQIPSIDSTGNIVANKWDKVAFYGSGTNFYLQLQPDATSSRQKINKILSDTLASVSFTYNPTDVTQANKISVNFSSAQQARQERVTGSLQQDMYLLNF